MKNLAKAFVELAGYLEIAKFDDPDEAQGAKGVIGICMVNATPEERAAIAEVAKQFAREAEQRGAIEDAKFYNSLSHWSKKPSILQCPNLTLERGLQPASTFKFQTTLKRHKCRAPQIRTLPSILE